MYYIFLDESDKHGKFFSYFYGGVIVASKDLPEFEERIRRVSEEVGIGDEEVKWQKVNAYTFEKYKRLVDEFFRLIREGKAKVRIFFSQNKNRYLFAEERRAEAYTILYYQFVKHAFGLTFAPKHSRFQLVFDELPIGDSQREMFKDFLCSLTFANIRREDILEVDSRKHLPLQMLDLVLGSICFRLNDKHKEKNPLTGKRGVRTIKRELLYKHIYGQICAVTGKRFNIGISTGITALCDKWTMPYLHWNFVPNCHTEDDSFIKHK